MQGLVEWYRKNHRALPWRLTRDPYAILVSEMMLQQTQVATVIPYWRRWMERFPTIEALAAAPIDDVLKHWQGLGYYARARNLHRAAQVLAQRFEGRFPPDMKQVLSLPGIGRYTAGAVCSIAFGQDVPIVDANVVRVLSRYFGLGGDPRSKGAQALLWQYATKLIPPGGAAEFNQAMMELGALVCRAKPECNSCPLSSACVALATGRQHTLPEFAPRPEFTRQIDVSAIIHSSEAPDRLLLIRRPPGGLWGGLYEFPRVTAAPEETAAEAAVRAAREVVGLAVRVERDRPLATVRHGVTTRKITLFGIGAAMTDPTARARPIGCDAVLWATPDEIDTLALASPQMRLAAQLRRPNPQLPLF